MKDRAIRVHRLDPLPNAAPFAAPPDCEELAPLPNALPLEPSAEWIEVPYAEVPNICQGQPTLQRLDQQAADALVARFNSWRGRLARLFGGLPFYVGHPDAKAFANAHTDKKAYGWIKDLEAGALALRLRVDWSAPGAELVNNAHYKYWSPFFLGRPTGARADDGTPIYIPVWLKSAGLTNNPNWPVAPLANEDPLAGAMETDMNLLQRLLAVIGLDTVKTEDDVVGHITKLTAAVAAMRGHIRGRWEAERAIEQALPMPNEGEELESLPALIERLDGRLAASAELPNEVAAIAAERDAALAGRDAWRAAAAGALVDAAVRDGRVLPAERDGALVPMANAATPDDFAAAALQLSQLPRKLKTRASVEAEPTRDSALRQRHDQVIAMVNERMEQRSEEYDAAFAWVRKAHPELFSGGAAETE